jgi:hypothetical protein
MGAHLHQKVAGRVRETSGELAANKIASLAKPMEPGVGFAGAVWTGRNAGIEQVGFGKCASWSGFKGRSP